MGVFTFCVAATLVSIQTTAILLGRVETSWSFQLVHAAPDSERWRPQLEALLPALRSASSNHDNNNNNNDTTTTLRLHIDAMMATAPPATVVCLQGLLLPHPHNDEWSAYECLIHGHTPRLAHRVLAPWNPHLLLLVLCGMQTLLAFARMRHNHLTNKHQTEEGDTTPTTTNTNTAEISITFVAVMLGLMLITCVAVQGAYDLDLIHYPTLLSTAMGLLTVACYFSLSSSTVENDDLWQLWSMLFHLQAVAIPTATLAMAVLGTRVWADALSVFCLLQAAVNLFWLQRFLLSGLVLLASFHIMHTQFGPFDTWRYVWCYLACTGLFVGVLALAFERPKRCAGLSLGATNVALVALMACLNQFQ
jgi:hypothetical protein